MHRHLALALLLVACKKKEAEAPPKPTPSVVVADAAPVVEIDAPASAFDPGELSTPESVLYDSGRDMYMIANINGEPGKADDNGYLTVANPDGSNERSNANWKWIDGSADDIKLDAPKGMAISGGTLYVADITVVRRFEAKAGKQLDDVKVEGAKFLNDVTSDGAGGVYVSDSGEGADAVYHVTVDGKVSALAKGKALGSPNGLWFDSKDTVWVVSGAGEIYGLDAKGKQGKATKLPTGALDGVVGIEGGEFLVSSWEGKCVYRGTPGGEWTAIVKDIEGPADIAYDPKRKRLLIPGFTTNKVIIHQL